MQGNAKGTYGSGCKLPGECRGMQGVQGNARGTHGSGRIVPEKCRGLPGECKEVGVKCLRNERECRGMPGECR